MPGFFNLLFELLVLSSSERRFFCSNGCHAQANIRNDETATIKSSCERNLKMAERRMISKSVLASDRFLDMSKPAQALYIQLILEADDDGFLSSRKRVMRVSLASEESYLELLANHFVCEFDNGILVVLDWPLMNHVQKDRYVPTVYQNEYRKLTHDELQPYHLDTRCIQTVSALDTQVSKGKDSGDQCSSGVCSRVRCNTEIHGGVPSVRAGQPECTLSDDICFRQTNPSGGRNEVLTHSEYETLIKDFPEELVKKQIHRILTKPYYGMLNIKSIRQLCMEHTETRQFPTGSIAYAASTVLRTPAEKWQGCSNNHYDFDELEKDILAN